MNTAAKQKVDEAIKKLWSHEIDWEAFEEAIAEACGPLPKMDVKVIYGAGVNSIKIINGDAS